MLNQHWWIISRLECYPERSGYETVVFAIHWRRQASDDAGHFADIFGVQSLTLKPDAKFTPYEELTKETVEGWLEEAMGKGEVDRLDGILDKQIADQVTPQVVYPPIPWDQTQIMEPKV